MVQESTLDNGLTVLVQEVHTAPLASVWCWYKVGSRDEGPGVTGVSHWVEHMNFKGTDQHSSRPGQGHHRALRRQLERLHLARSDDVPRDRHHRRPRPDAVHRGRTDGQLPLRPGRLRIGADGDHLRAAGRGERPRAAARHRDHGHRVQGPSLPASDHRLDPRPADDDPRRPLRALPPLLRAQQRDPGGGWRRRYRRRHAPGRARLRGHRPGRPGPAADDRGAGAGRRAPRAPAQAGDDRLLAGRLPRPAIHRSRLLSAAGPRRHPHRGLGAEHLVGRAGADTPTRRASLQGPRRPAAWPRRSAGSWRRLPSRSSTR